MEGFVRDANNFSPLSRATVDLFIGGEIGDSGVILAMEDLRYVYTDETGYYYIKRSTIFRGEYPKLYLRARAGGYHGSEFFSIQRTDAVQRIDIYLEPSEN